PAPRGGRLPRRVRPQVFRPQLQARTPVRSTSMDRRPAPPMGRRIPSPTPRSRLMPTPTPREFRRLERAANAAVLAGVREVERGRRLRAAFEASWARNEAGYRRLANPTEADLARAHAAPAPPRDRRGRTARDRFAPWERGGSYRLSTWDHEAQGWEPYWTGLSLMRIRAVLRLLYEAGWDKPSFL